MPVLSEAQGVILTPPGTCWKSSKATHLLGSRWGPCFLSQLGLQGHRPVPPEVPEQPIFSPLPPPHRRRTQIQVVSATNQPLARTSCGTEGFRNSKKGTGIAAQTAGIAAAAVSACPLRSLPPWRAPFLRGSPLGKSSPGTSRSEAERQTPALV